MANEQEILEQALSEADTAPAEAPEAAAEPAAAVPSTETAAPAAAVPAGTDAALFTRITAETEDWTGNAKKPLRAPKTRAQKEKRGFAVAAVIVAAFLVFAIVFTRPAPRVARAVRQGDFDRAAAIYWSTGLPEGERVSMIDKAILQAAEDICAQFAAHELEADPAAAALGKLGTLGEGAEALLADTYADFRALCSSQDRMAEAERLYAAGDYLEARAAYQQVVPEDSFYAQAQEQAAACLTGYAADVLAEAADYSLEEAYPEALQVLRTGNLTLEEFGTYSPEIDAAVETCLADIEQQILSDARALSAAGDNAGAAALIADGMETYELTNETMTAALAQYTELTKSGLIRDAVDAAQALCDSGDYAGGFAVLDALPETLPEDGDAVDAAIADFEQTFAADVIAAAEKIYGASRETLPEAVALLDKAIEARPLEEIEAYREDIARYLPLNLESADYLEKDGVVFRSTAAFESVDGTSFTEGWIWGENGAAVTFRLDGAYDVFTATLAVRRADSKNANGHFELYCDGERVFKSDTLYHWQKLTIPVSVDITGCDELKILFVTDYKVSTTEDGYCYHGLCTPLVMKNMPEAAVSE